MEGDSLKTQDSSNYLSEKCPQCFPSIIPAALNHRENQILLLNHVPLAAQPLNTKKLLQTETDCCRRSRPRAKY